MIKIYYRPVFTRKYKKLPKALQEEVKEKISIFKEDQNNKFLKTHKLKGKFNGLWSFSVNYKYRIIFVYLDKNTIALLSVGDHDVYN